LRIGQNVTTRIDLDSLDGILPLAGGETKVAERPVAARAPVPPIDDEGPTEAMRPVQTVVKTEPLIEDVTMAVPPPTFSAPSASVATPAPTRSKGPLFLAAAVILAVAAGGFWVLSNRETKSARSASTKTAVEGQAKPQAPSPSETKTAAKAPKESDAPSTMAGNTAVAERAVEPPTIAAAVVIQEQTKEVAVVEPQKPAAREASLNEGGTLLFPAFFEHDSWKPQLETQELTSVTQWLQACNGTIQLIGHTSLVGRDEINDAIGLARARAVQVLLKSQIKGRRVGIQSAGSREPMDRSAGEPAQSKNRRVQLKCDS
jgi:outer membrane protein OmpA-like peptidoglycan-associated protein